LEGRERAGYDRKVGPKESHLKRKISLAHSPDSDDAFMFYGLASGHVDCGDLEVEHVLTDIETLNQHAREGRHEVTAISFHAYPFVAHRYALMPCGGSIGDGYGPLLVAREALDPTRLGEREVAVPGSLTSAFLALKLFAPAARTRVVPFDRILDEVAEGRADVGLIIHEGQLTYGGHGLHRLLDLGAWWKQETGLPLPLGGNAVRRDVGPELLATLTRLVRETVRYSLEHRPQALDYALGFARGMERGVADRFVGMWVNEMTLDCGERGRRAVQELLDRGNAAGVIPHRVVVDFVAA
jgi:1,4-dihydroxy-6-naphthoate synthase